MKIGLLGCGAMGSLYGGYLSKVHEVYVCDVWKEHIEAIRANGTVWMSRRVKPLCLRRNTPPQTPAKSALWTC